MLKRVASVISLFTCFPIWVEDSDKKHISAYYPIVGWIVGGMGALVFYLSNLVFTQPIAVAITLMVSALVGKGIQERALAGFWWQLTCSKKRESEDKNSDNETGKVVSGALSISLSIVLQFAILQEISPVLLPFLIISGETLSRMFAVTSLKTTISSSSLKKGSFALSKLSIDGWLIALFVGLLPVFVLLRPKIWVALVPLLLFRIAVEVFFKWRKETIDFEKMLIIQQLCLVVFYLSISAIPNI